MNSFDEVVEILKENKIPCRVKELNDGIWVELGFDYPDELANKVFELVDVGIAAEISGGIQNPRSTLIAGGPKRYR